MVHGWGLSEGVKMNETPVLVLLPYSRLHLLIALLIIMMVSFSH